MIENEVKIRFANMDDGKYLLEWLLDPKILQNFPMEGEREVRDAVRIWIGYSAIKSCLMAEINGEPCGTSLLNISAYKKFAHQCLLSIVVGEKYRNKGIGTMLINEACKLAKETFKIEILHLEVYEGNPAISLYRRMGFKKFGYQKHFLKYDDKYMGKIFMQKTL